MIDRDRIREAFLGSELPLPAPAPVERIRERAVRRQRRRRTSLSVAVVVVAVMSTVLVVVRGRSAPSHSVRIGPLGAPTASSPAPVAHSRWPDADLPVHDVGALATAVGRLFVDLNPAGDSETTRPAPVERIDPTSGAVLATSASLPPGVLVVAGDTLWLISSTNVGGPWTADAYELDPGSLILQRTISLPVLAGSNVGGVSAAANSASIWFSTGKIFGRLDPGTGAVTTQGAVPDGSVTGVAVDGQNHVYLVTGTPIANTLTPLGPAQSELVQQRNATTGALQATTMTDTFSPLEDLSAASTDGFWGSEIPSGASPNDGVTPGTTTFTMALIFVASSTLRVDRVVTAPYVPATAAHPEVTNSWTSVSGGIVWFSDGTIGCASPVTHAVLAKDAAPVDSMQGAVVVGSALFVPSTGGGLVRLSPPAACRVTP